MDTFSYGATTCSIARPPLREMPLPEPLSQLSGVDSAGNRYVVSRPVRVRTLTVIFPRVTAAELADLKTFLTATVAGARRQFTWHDGSAGHAVRLTGWSWQQIDPAWYRIELTLEEVL